MRLAIWIFMAVAALALGGCSLARVDVRGYVPNDDDLARLEPGRQTRDDVQQLLGSPSTTGVFDAEQSWYYIYKKTSKVSFFVAETLGREMSFLEQLLGNVGKFNTASGATKH